MRVQLQLNPAALPRPAAPAGGALGLGLVAGLVSTLGYAKLSPYLERKLGLSDTCGIHNLHALPGVLGGIAAGVAAWSQSHVLLQHGNAQLGWQILAVLVSFGIGAGGERIRSGAEQNGRGAA